MVESKLNHEAVGAFAASFTRKVCDDFFESNDSISGREIVELTPVKQVNYFVLKILFRKWQREALRLQSPYFNYRNEDVRKALFSFMNVLSQQIMVSREHFEPLLLQATTEALMIVISPYEFFQSELTGHESGKLNDKYLKNSSKYIKVNQHVFEAYKEAFFQQSDGELTHQEAIVLLDRLFGENNLALEEVAEYEALFSQVEPIEFSTLTSGGGHGVVDDEEDEDFDDDSEPNDTEDDTKTVEDLEEGSHSDDDELIRFVDEDDESPQYETLDELESEKEDSSHGETKASFEFLADSDSADDDELGDSPLNKRFSSQKTSLHDKLKEEQRPTLAQVHQTQRIDNILASITVNQRYMFVNELFNGENDLFAEAMDKVETCDGFDEAVELLIQTYSKDLDWDMNAPEVKELLKIIFKKFR